MASYNNNLCHTSPLAAPDQDDMLIGLFDRKSRVRGDLAAMRCDRYVQSPGVIPILIFISVITYLNVYVYMCNCSVTFEFKVLI